MEMIKLWMEAGYKAFNKYVIEKMIGMLTKGRERK